MKVLLGEFEEFIEIFAVATKSLQSQSLPTFNLIFGSYLSVRLDLTFVFRLAGFRNNAIVNKLFYTIAFENINKRLKPSKIQLCGALIYTVWCKIAPLLNKLRIHHDNSHGIDHIVRLKYKLDHNTTNEEPLHSASQHIASQSASRAAISTDHRRI